MVTREARKPTTWAARSVLAAIQTRSLQRTYSAFRTSGGHPSYLGARAPCCSIPERHPEGTPKFARDICMEAALYFDIHRRLFVRAEYRGIFYDSPTFNVNALNGLDRFT